LQEWAHPRTSKRLKAPTACSITAASIPALDLTIFSTRQPNGCSPRARQKGTSSDTI